ncbi:MAG TPA: SagB/ThcOx family dehydrogenase, partial [Allocoleopsis sp.]
DSTQLAIVVTAVFMRSAWRYQDRAYRRILLDTGHLLGNLELACTLNDYRPHLMGGFIDEAVNKLLYVDPDQEGATVVAALADVLEVAQNLPLSAAAIPSKIQTEYTKVPDGELLLYFHQATQLTPEQDPRDAKRKGIRLDLPDPTEPDVPQLDKYNFPFCLKVPTVSPPIDWGKRLELLEKTILQRRSTRTYSGANLTLDELRALLNFTYHAESYIDQGLDRIPDYFGSGLIETFIAVSGIDGLDEGCYYYAPKAQELRQIRFKNFRRELHRLCLGQNLGRDAAAVLFHTADLQQAVSKYGDRVYRYLHMDAGHLGQRLNLAAIRLGLGVSGIGGFFDDEVNDVLGIPADEAVLYITTLGRPR